MREDKFVRELLNEKVYGKFRVTLTKLVSKFSSADVCYLITVNDGRPVPMFSRSYKTLGAAKREYNKWGK